MRARALRPRPDVSATAPEPRLVVYRSHRGPDQPWNLTTLCAWHHQRGAHGTGLKVRGRAPDDLVFELGVGRFRSGDRKIAD